MIYAFIQISSYENALIYIFPIIYAFLSSSVYMFALHTFTAYIILYQTLLFVRFL